MGLRSGEYDVPMWRRVLMGTALAGLAAYAIADMVNGPESVEPPNPADIISIPEGIVGQVGAVATDSFDLL